MTVFVVCQQYDYTSVLAVRSKSASQGSQCHSCCFSDLRNMQCPATSTAAGPICLKCDRIQQPYDCDNVVRCGSHELCSVRKFLTDDGHRWFDVGCLDSQRCSVAVFGRRGVHIINETKQTSYQRRTHAGEITECELCCKGHICNTGTMCGAKTLHHSGHSLCFKCDSESTPDGCNTITMCTQDEECFIQSHRIGLSGSIAWSSGCKRKDACKQFTSSPGSGCHACCTSTLCNRRCSTTSSG